MKKTIISLAVTCDKRKCYFLKIKKINGYANKKKNKRNNYTTFKILFIYLF